MSVYVTMSLAASRHPIVESGDDSRIPRPSWDVIALVKSTMCLSSVDLPVRDGVSRVTRGVSRLSREFPLGHGLEGVGRIESTPASRLVRGSSKDGLCLAEGGQ
jgi:hypothetical protein